MQTLTRTELIWIQNALEQSIHRNESMLETPEYAGYAPILNLDIKNKRLVYAKLQTVLDKYQKRIAIR